MGTGTLLNHQSVILFDDECLLCNRSVAWLIKHDKKKIFRYGRLNEVMQLKLGVPSSFSGVDSVILRYQDKFYIKSKAVLKVLSLLGLPYSLTNIFYLLPLSLTDALYDMVALHRQKRMGSNTCLIPSAQEQKLFLD